jgi:hypothetical protein
MPLAVPSPEGKRRRAELVSEPGQQVDAVLVGQLLTELGAAPRQSEAAVLSPADQATVEGQRLPGPTGRREVDVSGAVAPVIGDRFHSAADPDPCWTGR